MEIMVADRVDVGVRDDAMAWLDATEFQRSLRAGFLCRGLLWRAKRLVAAPGHIAHHGSLTQSALR